MSLWFAWDDDDDDGDKTSRTVVEADDRDDALREAAGLLGVDPERINIESCEDCDVEELLTETAALRAALTAAKARNAELLARAEVAEAGAAAWRGYADILRDELRGVMGEGVIGDATADGEEDDEAMPPPAVLIQRPDDDAGAALLAERDRLRARLEFAESEAAETQARADEAVGDGLTARADLATLRARTERLLRAAVHVIDVWEDAGAFGKASPAMLTLRAAIVETPPVTAAPPERPAATPTPRWGDPCPHPMRRGAHEVYVRRGGGEVCRACGAESDRPAPATSGEPVHMLRSLTAAWCGPVRGAEMVALHRERATCPACIAARAAEAERRAAVAADDATEGLR